MSMKEYTRKTFRKALVAGPSLGAALMCISLIRSCNSSTAFSWELFGAMFTLWLGASIVAFVGAFATMFLTGSRTRHETREQ